ncbi:MAG: hypothetical protein Q8S84_09190 [bacterium]|nr:hypothetical protein [bacterium]
MNFKILSELFFVLSIVASTNEFTDCVKVVQVLFNSNELENVIFAAIFFYL